jgi:putative transposase
MARPKTIGVQDVLQTLLPRRTVDQFATDAKLVQRRRKIDALAFFWTLVLGFGTGEQRTLAALRRAYQLATGVQLVASSFYDHFTPALVRFLKAAAGFVLAQVAEPVRALRGPLAHFRDLVVTDSTVIRLHDLLEKAFPACRTNHTLAALKMHAVLSVLGAGPRSVRVTSERVHDGPVFQVGPWVKDRLLLFDLAYFRYQLMSCIRRNGGFFIVRLKKNANPMIVALHLKWRGRSVPLLGERIQEVVQRLTRQAIDVEVEVTFKRRAYGGVRHTARERFRLVGVRDEHSGEYHLYLTNIPPERLSPRDIATTYAARWAVELFFRELKSRYRTEQMPSSKREVVEALLYAVLLTVAVSRALLERVRRKLGELARRVPTERWATLFAQVAGDLLRLVLGRSAEVRGLCRSVERFLLHEAVDPNVSRRLLLERVESRTQFQDRYSVAQRRA